MKDEKIFFERVQRFKDDKTVNLPYRATRGSAGYDFEAVEDILIKPFKPVFHLPVLVKTGIKIKMPPNIAFLISNRSSGPKKGLVLANGLGLIDSDYYSNPDNDGEIMFAYYNFSINDILIKKGQAIGQGFFINLVLADDDTFKIKNRTGGFGSTSF